MRREMFRFLLVGVVCFTLSTGLNYVLKFTVLTTRPVTALALAVVVATVVSYFLNREWSFHTRGGRRRHHEAALFFLVSAVGVVLNSAPLYVSRYVFGLAVPRVGLVVQETADFVSGIVVGSLLAMVFRFVAFRRWVFPQADVRSRAAAGAGGDS